MVIYSTKYALTKGIAKIEVVDCYIDGMVHTPGSFSQYFHKGEYESTKEQAIKKANEMRDKKIENLKRQIKKLQTMDFSL